jgi:hypothetical protein
MINELLSTFGVHKGSLILGVASNVVRAFETEFANDHDTKKAAIAALLAILEAHKDAPPPPAPVNAPVAPAK